MQNVIERDMKRFPDPKALTFGVWGLKTNLEPFEPKALGKELKILTLIYTSRTSFSQELWDECTGP